MTHPVRSTGQSRSTSIPLPPSGGGPVGGRLRPAHAPPPWFQGSVSHGLTPTDTPECPLDGHACRVPEQSRNRTVRWATLEDKAHWLDAAASRDAMRGGVRRVAAWFARGYPTAEGRTRAIQRWVRDRIRYVYDFRVSQDARGEEFADAETTIERGYEDCDGKARTFVALVRAAEAIRRLGVVARIRPVFRRAPAYEFVHVQAEVSWPGGPGWLLCELILAGCEIGQNPDDMPRLGGVRRLA